MSRIKKVAVIGTGVIGVGWTIRLLAHNIKVLAYDKNLIQRNNLIHGLNYFFELNFYRMLKLLCYEPKVL